MKRYIAHVHKESLVYRNVNHFPHTAPLFPLNRTQKNPNIEDWKTLNFFKYLMIIGFQKKKYG